MIRVENIVPSLSFVFWFCYLLCKIFYVAKFINFFFSDFWILLYNGKGLIPFGIIWESSYFLLLLSLFCFFLNFDPIGISPHMQGEMWIQLYFPVATPLFQYYVLRNQSIPPLVSDFIWTLWDGVVYQSPCLGCATSFVPSLCGTAQSNLLDSQQMFLETVTPRALLTPNLSQISYSNWSLPC